MSEREDPAGRVGRRTRPSPEQAALDALAPAKQPSLLAAGSPSSSSHQCCKTD